jgi:hypothetical protein
MEKDAFRGAHETSSVHQHDAREDTGGAGDLLRALADFVRDSLTLLVLEGRLAIISLIVMATAGIVAAVLALSAWLFSLAAMAVWLISIGWPPAVVLLGIAGANAFLGLLCWFLIVRLSRNLLFTASRRNLGFKHVTSASDAQVDAT